MSTPRKIVGGVLLVLAALVYMGVFTHPGGAPWIRLLLACVAATPFLSPALVAVFVGPAVTFSPLALGLRLVLMLAGAACVGIAVRAIAHFCTRSSGAISASMCTVSVSCAEK